VRDEEDSGEGDDVEWWMMSSLWLGWPLMMVVMVAADRR